MKRMFRFLNADEVECRVSTVKLPDGDKKGGVSLLLYKDARVDQTILDETVGPMNWQRKHTRDNANCIVSLWDDDKQMWIDKEDTGTESSTEAEKGLASDSFKRACFNWGIGRELYTAPFIWISSDDCRVYEYKGKGACADRFDVTKMDVEDGRITALEIQNMNTKKQVYKWSSKKQEPKQEESKQEEKLLAPSEAALEMKKEILILAGKAKVSTETILKQAGLKSMDEMTAMVYAKLKIALLDKIKRERDGADSKA